MKNQPEKLLQQQCYQLFLWKYSNTGAMWHHSPNENLSTVSPLKAMIYNNDLKKAGRQKGFADVAVFYNGKTIFIELKASKGRQSPEQKEFQAKIEKTGFEYFLCRSVDEVDAVLSKFFLYDNDR